MLTIKQIKKGDFFVLKPHNETEAKESEVYIRGEYDRTEKKYECQKWNDICSTRYFKGDKEVYQDFIF